MNLISEAIIPSVTVSKVIGSYIIKTATTDEERKQAFRLRYEVFHEEFAGKPSSGSSEALDFELYDLYCDHLIVKDLRSMRVVACYRLLSSLKKSSDKKFYSESEFQINEFLLAKDSKLELGRACVHKNYRRGTVLLLLWRGVIDYAKKCDTRYLFGCSSISKDYLPYLSTIINDIETQKKFINEWNVTAHEDYSLDFMIDAPLNVRIETHSSLMQIYLDAGARVARSLAYDRDFNCVDLFTILDLHNLPEAFNKGFS